MAQAFHIQWHLTDACNLRCRHCYQDGYSPVKELSPKNLQTILNNLEEFLNKKGRKLSVDLTGGEPLLFPSLWTLLDLIEPLSWVESVGIITNGILLTPKTIARLSSYSKVKTLKLSCEGTSRQSYEENRGKNFLSFLKGIESCRGFQGEKFFLFTLYQENRNELSSLFSFTEKSGFNGFIVERFFPMGQGSFRGVHLLSQEEWRETGAFLMESANIPTDLSLIASYRGFLLRKTRGWNIFGAPCIIAKDGCAIMPEGNVFPCRRFPYSLGSLLSTSMQTIWYHDLLRALRRRKNLQGFCHNCPVKECKGCRALAFCLTSNPFAEDPLCFLSPPKRGSDMIQF
jgi:radical SAM protein with 4Fe4S-binding SPASM domain